MPKMVAAVTPGKSSKRPNGLCRSDAAISELLESEPLPDIPMELMLPLISPPELPALLAAPDELPPAEPANGLLLPAGAPPTAEPAPLLLPLADGLPPALDPLPELEALPLPYATTNWLPSPPTFTELLVAAELLLGPA